MIRKYLKKNRLAVILIFLISFFWGYKYKNEIFTKTDIDLAGKKYSTSQYVLGDASPEPIKDSTVYIYAGSRYVAGESPTQINFEHPPLGKYILGLSWKLFGNVIIFNYFLYIGILFLFWNLSKLIIKEYGLRIVSLLLLASLKIIPHYVFQGMLDTLLLFATLLFFYGILMIKKENWRTFIIGIAMGSYMSIKYFFPSIFLFGLILLIDSYQKNNYKFLFKTIFISISVYLLSYSRYFWLNPNPIDFVKFEWFRFRWWTGERTIPKFLLISTIFTGKFKGWWAENQYEYASSWSIFWPIIFSGWIFSFLNLKTNYSTKIMALFSLGMFLLYIFGSASNERYLVQLLPFWILLSISFLKKLCNSNNFSQIFHL